jgi:hypothetical protein
MKRSRLIVYLAAIGLAGFVAATCWGLLVP